MSYNINRGYTPYKHSISNKHIRDVIGLDGNMCGPISIFQVFSSFGLDLKTYAELVRSYTSNYKSINEIILNGGLDENNLFEIFNMISANIDSNQLPSLVITTEINGIDVIIRGQIPSHGRVAFIRHTSNPNHWSNVHNPKRAVNILDRAENHEFTGLRKLNNYWLCEGRRM